MSDDISEYMPDGAEDTAAVDASRTLGSNEYFHNMLDRNFIEYASYAIKDRAIPNVDDGLKPVQRRILWAMHKTDDYRTNKAAFVVGEVMGKYHPHGDASIKDALVVLANKEYFIEKQGNFGNIFTGSSAAAARYIECGLTPMAREVLYNDDITELVDTYDGRNMEPVVLPVKIPALLMLGSDGIAVGMATKIMPHNFNELLQAQIAALNGEPFELYPDFLQGGLMDVREYADGNGKITLRARIDIVDRKLIIREIPATTTTEGLIASIEKAAERNKIKISSVNDYTAQNVEIEVVPTRGYDAEKALRALYMYTDCSVSISPNLTVIRDFRPAVMTVTDVIFRNTGKLLEYLRNELEIALDKQNELFHAKTLAQIFFENRIYKRIEECRDVESEYREVHSGLAPFRRMLRRDVTDGDVDKLLALPVRRIARFDIEKNQRELREIEEKIAAVLDNMVHLKKYAVDYLNDLLKKYGHLFPRRTEIESFAKIDRKAAALNNIKIGWDRKNGYIGTGIKSDDTVTCNEFDRLLLLDRKGKYKITSLPPDKLFVGKLFDCRKYDPRQEFGIVYRDVKSGKCYGKRSTIGSFIKDREYNLCPEGCRIELFTPRADAVYAIAFDGKKSDGAELNLMTLPVRSAKARGFLVGGGKIAKLTHLRYLTEEELAAVQPVIPDDAGDKGDDGEIQEVTDHAAENGGDGNDADAALRKKFRKLRSESRIPGEIALAKEKAELILRQLKEANDGQVTDNISEEETGPLPDGEADSVCGNPSGDSAGDVSEQESVDEAEVTEDIPAAETAVPEDNAEKTESAAIENIPVPEPEEENIQDREAPEETGDIPEVTEAETPEEHPDSAAADVDIPPFVPDEPVSQPPPPPPVPSVMPRKVQSNADQADELGIVQPEFGF